MKDLLVQIKNCWDQTADSDWYRSLRAPEKINTLVQEPASAFHPAVYDLIKKYIPNLQGRKLLLPSSGDNHAAFAFALMGADVISTDISEKQLEYAQEIAHLLNLNIRFLCDDTMALSNLENNQFDLVYTSNGTHSWIVDLEIMYQNVYRVLKPGGYSVMYDIHPFNRPFTGAPWQRPKIVKPYDETMPHCHWRVQDLVNAMANAGLTLREMEELQAVNPSFWFSYEELIQQKADELEQINNWKENPMAALPAWLSIVAQK